MALTKEQKAKVIQLRNEKLGYKRIAKLIGSNKDQVRFYCKSQGLDGTLGKVEQKKFYTCKNCGQQFNRTDEYKSTIYCSAECNKEYKLKAKEKKLLEKMIPCETCGKMFIKTTKQIHCSHECCYETIECKHCGKPFEKRRSSNQVYCSKKCIYDDRTKTHEEYYKIFSKIHKGLIVPITKYQGSNHDLKVYCLDCHNITTRKANHYIEHRRRRGCSHCNPSISNGEKIVEEWLIDKGIKYISQYSVEELKDKGLLKFDFAIVNEDDDVTMLIEYNGRQHYEPVKAFGGEQEFIRQQRSDAMKKQYAIENNIKLLDISYKQKDVEDILKREVLV